jgi:hypothetical protein
MKTAVVFIHGFMGGENTWKSGAGVSFIDLLNSDDELTRDFDFFEFDYYTKLTDCFDSAPFQKIARLIPIINRFPTVTGRTRSNRPIAQLSEELGTYLSLVLAGYERVVLVAHSMGGLIAKDHILNYQTGHGPKPIGYISVAVPHKGSLTALLLGSTKNINAKELVPLSEYSDNLNNNWGQQKNNLPRCLYMIAQHDECVDKNSATPFSVQKSEKATLNHDHSSICKPDSVADLSYLAVSAFLKDISYQQKMAAMAVAITSMSTPDYDKEIFVLKMIVCDIGPKGVEDAKDCYFNAEIISKAANRLDAEELRSLQRKVLSVYKQKYNEFSGKSVTANDVFAQVHAEILAQDGAALRSSVVYLNFLHKKGLLHQLANNIGQTVVWADDTDFEKIRQGME